MLFHLIYFFKLFFSFAALPLGMGFMDWVEKITSNYEVQIQNIMQHAVYKPNNKGKNNLQ
jgi:hypothetical protein